MSKDGQYGLKWMDNEGNIVEYRRREKEGKCTGCFYKDNNQCPVNTRPAEQMGLPHPCMKLIGGLLSDKEYDGIFKLVKEEDKQETKREQKEEQMGKDYRFNVGSVDAIDLKKIADESVSRDNPVAVVRIDGWKKTCIVLVHGSVIEKAWHIEDSREKEPNWHGMDFGYEFTTPHRIDQLEKAGIIPTSRLDEPGNLYNSSQYIKHNRTPISLLGEIIKLVKEIREAKWKGQQTTINVHIPEGL